MSEIKGIYRYTRSEMLKFNNPSLRIIPSNQFYQSLFRMIGNDLNHSQSYVSQTGQQSSVIVPTYLKNRYGEVKVTRGSGDVNTTRKKLYIAKLDTFADRVNGEFRDLLSKISERNKNQLMPELMKMEIPDECGITLIDNLYTFAVDITYLLQLQIYIDVIFILKIKNSCLFNQLIDRIINTAFEPLPSSVTESNENVKRLRIGNLHMLSEIYLRDATVISEKIIMNVAQFLMDQANPSKSDYLHLLCELLKKVIIRLGRPMILQQFLEKIKCDHSYDKKTRFKIQDVLELS